MATGTTTKMTYEDYLLIPEDGLRHEIIDGEHVVSPSPSTRHQQIIMNFVRALDGFVYPRRLGKVFAAPLDVVLSGIDVVQPDVLFIGNARLHQMTRPNIQGAPELAIEVLSESNRRNDEILKKKRYELFGVEEYWIADPELESVKIYRRAGERFAAAEIISTETGGTIATPLLPGFELPIESVFEE